jgi:hypothetical protein
MVKRSEEAPTATQGNERSGTSGLLELALTRENLQAALKRVRKNKGSPGIDGMTVDALPEHLKAHWSELREQLLAGAYRPSMVKAQLIPKGNGGVRKLGIPTVLDRFAYSAAFDQPFRRHPIRIPVIRSGIGAKRRGRGLVRRWVESRVGVSDLSGGAWTSRAG